MSCRVIGGITFFIVYTIFFSFLFVINDGPSVKDQIKKMFYLWPEASLSHDGATLDTPALRLVVN